MLRHIVMIKFKDPVSKDAETLKLKQMLENLVVDIPSLLAMEVGININTRPTSFDLVLVSDFENETALNAYRLHPSHKEVLEYMKNIVDKTAVVDYMY